ncbi:SHOCT domain-containing protein [Actinopolymorpha singaporensis]
MTKLAQLREHGDLSEAEFQQAKSKILILTLLPAVRRVGGR